MKTVLLLESVSTMKKWIVFLILCSFPCQGYSAAREKIPKDKPKVRVVSTSWIGAGFFAELKNVIFNLIYRSDHKVPKILVVDWTQEFFPYKDDCACNGWDLYFEPIHSERVFEDRLSQCPPEPNHDQPYCINRWLRYKEYLPYRQFVHDRFKRYITIKLDVLNEVNGFYDRWMKERFCIGMHVRFATAHASENPYSPLLKLQDFIREAKEQWELHRDKNPIIFLATDSYYVIEEFKVHFDESQLVFINAYRAKYKEDPHLIYERQKYFLEHPDEFHKCKPGYFGGLTTLMDCLLLSKCQVMIHSLSNVSDFAAWFNPHLESVFLPKGVEPAFCPCENLFTFFNSQ